MVFGIHTCCYSGLSLIISFIVGLIYYYESAISHLCDIWQVILPFWSSSLYDKWVGLKFLSLQSCCSLTPVLGIANH